MQAIIENKQCPWCHDFFEPNHGNRIYCSEDCYLEIKGKKQKENNSLMQQCKKGFLNNYNYFQRILPETGSASIPLLKLLKTGFDQDAYYGTVIDKSQQEWHKVNEYLFCITKKQGQPVLTIYKP